MNTWSKRTQINASRMEIVGFFLVLALLAPSGESFYLPGLAPVTYCNIQDDKKCLEEIPLYVNRLNSEESVIPFEYNHFDFCQATGVAAPAENLGQVVFGERITPSPYTLKFLKDQDECKIVCNRAYAEKDSTSTAKINFLKKGIVMNYQHHWIVDNMPVTWCYPVEGGQQYCATGFPMGCYVDKNGNAKDACVMDPKYNSPDTHYIFNHIDLKITYHSAENAEWGKSMDLSEGQHAGRIVSIKVTPRSINHKAKTEGNCDESLKIPEPMSLPKASDKKSSVSYSYRVTYEKDDSILWSSRWDYILERYHSIFT